MSVICPCFNAAEFVSHAIRSVRSQTLQAWEMIVVDDGSTDRSAAVIASHCTADQRVRLVERPNGGVAAARNTGFARTSGTDFLLFLDADDALRPLMLERMTGYLDDHPGVGAVHCAWSYIGADGQPISLASPRLLPRMGRGRFFARRIPDHDPVTPFESIFCAAGITPSMTLVRRSAYEQGPGWDEGFGQPAEDTTLFLHLALLAPVHYVPEPLVQYRVHPHQSTEDADRLGSQWKRLLHNWSHYDCLPERHRLVVSRAWQFRDRQYTLTNAARRCRFEIGRGKPVQGARFAAGAARIAFRSVRRPS